MGFLYFEQLRNMEQDYGIIPSPKFNETQKDYSAVVHDIATLICLPQTATNEEIGAVLGDGLRSYRTVTPTTNGDEDKICATSSPRIIDLLHDYYMTDIAYVFGSSFYNLGYTGRDMIANNQSNFASYYSKREKAALKQMEKLIEAYLSLE